jgi:hypothetical protein
MDAFRRWGGFDVRSSKIGIRGIQRGEICLWARYTYDAAADEKVGLDDFDDVEGRRVVDRCRLPVRMKEDGSSLKFDYDGSDVSFMGD